ncbi:MAG: leucyl aminopeptidase family protein, partial [Candidatus Saccharimonadales bacterium]
LKPADAMKGMKWDMCGGATVIAAIRAAAALRLPIRIKAYCAATTNRTGSNAYLVDDVVTGLDGKTYEIKNTDAEGRLTLVDAITYARKFGKVSRIVDLATLTGAIVVALGDIYAGGFTNNQKWFDQVKAASESVGERIWQMPADEEYDEYNASDFADISNTGGRWGGAVSAAKFVLSAAGGLPVAHLDIAGTAFRDRAFEADPKGGTGFGVRTLVALLESLSKKKPAKKAKKPVRRAKR